MSLEKNLNCRKKGPIYYMNHIYSFVACLRSVLTFGLSETCNSHFGIFKVWHSHFIIFEARCSHFDPFKICFSHFCLAKTWYSHFGLFEARQGTEPLNALLTGTECSSPIYHSANNQCPEGMPDSGVRIKAEMQSIVFANGDVTYQCCPPY